MINAGHTYTCKIRKTICIFFNEDAFQKPLLKNMFLKHDMLFSLQKLWQKNICFLWSKKQKKSFCSKIVNVSLTKKKKQC